MILNAGYNAGPWSNISKTYLHLCANADNPAFQTQISHINDYTLDDKAYQQAINTQEASGSTFILYPRQIRFYLDQLYNNPTPLATHTTLNLSLSQIRFVFAQSMHSLAWVNKNHYDFIAINEAETAFDAATLSLSLSLQDTLDIGKPADRQQLFQLLNQAITDLALQNKIDFSETTENDWNTSNQVE